MLIIIGILITFIVITVRNKNKGLNFINWIFDKFGWFFLAGFFIGVPLSMANLEDTFIYNDIIVFLAILFISMPALIVRYIIRTVKKKIRDKGVLGENTISNEMVSTLPDNENARRSILNKFSNKLFLNLTEKQIETIVKSSYSSDEWASELQAMMKNYKSEAEWYKGDTDWLRVYLKVFNVQNISSDFAYQKSICLENFERVFSEIQIERFATIEDCIEAINQKFLTNFDDMTFMKAYRFLQAGGYNYRLPGSDIISVDSELDKLKKQYDSNIEG